MKKFTFALIAAMVLSVAAYAQEASEEIAVEESPAISANIAGDFLSAYVWKGQVLNKEWVFQPEFYVGLPHNLYFDLWGTMDLSDSDSSCCPGTEGKWSEIDIEVGYDIPFITFADFSVAGIYMTYPQDGPDEDYDLQASVSKELALTDNFSITPKLIFRHRLSDHDDWGLVGRLSPSWAICDSLSFGVDCEVGYAGSYFVNHSYGSKDEAAFTHAQAIAKLSYSLTEKLSLALKGGYSTVIDSDLRDDMKAVDEDGNKAFPDVDYFFGGVSFSYDL